MLADTYDRFTFLAKRFEGDDGDGGVPAADYSAFAKTVITLVKLLDEEYGDVLLRAWKQDYEGYYTIDELRNEVWTALHNQDLEHTPWDKFLPWIYREFRKSSVEVGGNITVDDMVDLLEELPDWQRATRTDLGKFTFAAAQKAVNAWIVSEAARRIAYKFRNGWYVRTLIRRKELEHEGAHMGHCVSGKEWYCGVRRGTKIIYSLRDPRDHAHVTIEWDPGTKHFKQMKMEENMSPPDETYRPMLVEFVQKVHGGDPVGLLLTGTPATELDLRGANFMGVDLPHLNLDDFIGADLTKANFVGADISGVLFTDAVLVGADLRQAVMAGTDLTNADLRGADLTGARMLGVIQTGTIFDETTTMPDGHRWTPPAGLGRRQRRF